MILQELVDMIDVGLKAINKSYNEVRICELGDQRMKWNEFKTGKNYLLNKGVIEHISMDWNGKNGALPIDLAKPVEPKYVDYFNMVTNYGTLEHVENGLYQAFKNVHNMTKAGGVIIHAGPIAGSCPWHSPYHWESWFFAKLADTQCYKKILNDVRVCQGKRGAPEIHRTVVCSVMTKENDNEFMSEQTFKGIGGIEGYK